MIKLQLASHFPRSLVLSHGTQLFVLIWIKHIIYNDTKHFHINRNFQRKTLVRKMGPTDAACVNNNSEWDTTDWRCKWAAEVDARCVSQASHGKTNTVCGCNARVTFSWQCLKAIWRTECNIKVVLSFSRCSQKQKFNIFCKSSHSISLRGKRINTTN